VGYFLLRLLLKPMKEALHLLDRFIKDTTHELNTPVNAIISNVEMIEQQTLEPKLAKKIRRIDIGAKTISNIYQDLTYLTLGHQLLSQDEQIDVATLLQERLEYFQTLMDAKKLDLSTDLHPAKLRIDRSKFAKVIDNLLSNAIKYNRVKGRISVSNDARSLSIEDSGRGIEKEKIDRMFERFARFDSSVGGFGIGLSIVSMIAKEYGLAIHIDSTPKKGTKVTLSW
jgi:two-component system OmpR family sensor kinase